MRKDNNACRDLLFGFAIGDALGVPVEFESRDYLTINPVSDMISGGSHNQPLGTFSDDSSLTFCLADAICTSKEQLNLEDIAKKIIEWSENGYWAVNGKKFDIGISTENFVHNVLRGMPLLESGGSDFYDNGNGSLMRIAPLLFYLKNIKNINERFIWTKKVSSITHRHSISIIACFYYLEFLREIYNCEIDKFEAYKNLQIKLPPFLNQFMETSEFAPLFSRLLQDNIWQLDASKIKSDGFVISTLEASIWSFLTANSYEESVLKAINLGDDTDTTGAITGSLSGLFYGFDSIPNDWVNKLLMKNEIEDLAQRLFNWLK
jgi:ADP-ribosylglycohydrolase